MRQIKFRGKRLDNGELIEFNLFQCYHDGNKFYVTHDEHHQGFLSSRTIWFEVDPSTVGQFTGLHDKNGKEIYEGDVDQHNQVVIFNYGRWELHHLQSNVFSQLYDFKDSIEITGNIHEKEVEG